MGQALLAFRWYLVVQAFGLAALPLCLRLFRHLPDRGYGMSRPLGLLLAGWAFWLLTTFGWLRNTAGGILIALALLAVVSLLSLVSPPSARSESDTLSPLRWLGERWRIVVVTESLFAVAFVAWCLVRAHMPRIETAGGEKWMEIAFLRAILRSDTFPPHDPWLSGFAISYYYFGYLIVAMLTRLAAVPPSIAFNLGIAMLFALTCTGAFSLVYNLVCGVYGPQDARHRRLSPILGGLLGPLLVTVVGNLEGLLEVLHARGAGPAAFWAWLDIRNIDGPPAALAEGSWVPTRFFWWWQASRVLQDYTPWGEEQHVIDEFPAFSFILGDMHPHVLAVPFVLLALALALNLYLCIYLRSRAGAGESAPAKLWEILRMAKGGTAVTVPFTAWEFLVYALCLGGLGFLNTWDFPIYIFVVVTAYTLAQLHVAPRASRLSPYVLRSAFLALALLLAGVFLYLPFWVGFQSQAGGILLNLFNATRLPQFLVMFGPLVFIVAAFVADGAVESGVPLRAVLRWTLVVALGILGVLALMLGVAVVLVWLGVIPPQGPAAYLAAWLRGGPIPGLEDVANARALLSQSLFWRLVNPWTGLVLIALLVTIALLLRDRLASILHPPSSTLEPPVLSIESPASSVQSPVSSFILLLAGLGALLTLSVEYVYLRDHFGTRMNTVFKFYFQAWVMWGIAGAYALVSLLRRGRGWVVLVAVALVAAGLVYPVLAIPARAHEQGGPPTLDGSAYLAEARPDDYAAIAWLNKNVGDAPVILEAPGDRFRAYVYEGRVSAHTGLPTLLGWAGHEHQWRGSYDEQARREPDIETLYTSVSPGEVLTLLDKYGIRYIYVGPLERARYPAAGLAKFGGLAEIVYEAGTVTIYRYSPPAQGGRSQAGGDPH